jgi:hypothetical protein
VGRSKLPPKNPLIKPKARRSAEVALREEGVEVIKNNKLIITKILLFMSRSRVFVTPPALSVPPNATFKAYLINTNGLRPTKCPPLSEGTDPVKLNKIKLLRDLANRWKLDAIHLTETLDQNLVALGPLKEWHSMPSTPTGEGTHSTAMLTSLPPNDTRVDTNVSATYMVSHSLLPQ